MREANGRHPVGDFETTRDDAPHPPGFGRDRLLIKKSRVIESSVFGRYAGE
jgi:hypothetical protein